MKEERRKEEDLTKVEKKRLEIFKKNCKELEEKGYKRHDLLASIKHANTTGLLVPLPVVVIYAILYFLLGNSFIFDDISDNLFLFFLLSFFSIIIHESLHGITHAIFAKNHFKDISFGVVWSQLTPYCTCNAYEKRYQYLLSTLMPFFVLGLIFSIITLFLNSTLFFFIAIVNILATSGDLIVVSLILKNKSKKKDVLYYDHPTDIGVIMFDK